MAVGVAIAALFIAPPVTAHADEPECSPMLWYQNCYHRWDDTWWTCNYYRDGRCEQVYPLPTSRP